MGMPPPPPPKAQTVPPPPPPKSNVINVDFLKAHAQAGSGGGPATQKLTLAPDLVLTAAEIAGKSIGIFGTMGSGKTTTVRRVFEQMIKANMAFTIVDIENEYAALKEVGEVYLAGPKNEFGNFELDVTLTNEKQYYALGRRAYLTDLHVILMFSEMDDFIRKLYLNAYLTGVFEAAANPSTRRPHWMALEECHEYCPQVGLSKDDALRLTILRVAKRGRKRGLFLIPMSQRPANIDKDVLTQCKIFIGHAVEFPHDINYYKTIFRLDNLDGRIANMKPGDALFRMGNVEKLVTIIHPETESPSATPGAIHVNRFVQARAAEQIEVEISEVEDRESTSIVSTAYLRQLEEAIPTMKAAMEKATETQITLEARIAELEGAVPAGADEAALYAQVMELTRKNQVLLKQRTEAERLAGPITQLVEIIESRARIKEPK